MKIILTDPLPVDHHLLQDCASVLYHSCFFGLIFLVISALPNNANLKQEMLQLLELTVKEKIRKLQAKHRDEIKKLAKVKRKSKV